MMEKNLKKDVTEALCYVLKLIQHCISTILQFLKDYIFREVLGSQQTWAESTKIFHWLPAPTRY